MVAAEAGKRVPGFPGIPHSFFYSRAFPGSPGAAIELTLQTRIRYVLAACGRA